MKKAIELSEIIFICVGTPNKKGSLNVDLSFVYKCTKEILKHTKKKKKYLKKVYSYWNNLRQKKIVMNTNYVNSNEKKKIEFFRDILKKENI